MGVGLNDGGGVLWCCEGCSKILGIFNPASLNDSAQLREQVRVPRSGGRVGRLGYLSAVVGCQRLFVKT